MWNLLGIFVDRAEGVRHVAIVLIGPAIDAAGCHAGGRHGFAAHEIRDVGLMHQQVGRDAAGIIPIKPPLVIALQIERPLGSGAQESSASRCSGAGIGGNVVAPGRIVVERIAIPEGADVMDVADHALGDHLLGPLIQRVAAILRADLDDLCRTFCAAATISSPCSMVCASGFST